MITLLPVELLFLLLSYLPALRDRLALRSVSKRFRSICKAPSLWHSFVWPSYDRRDELCVSSVLKCCGEHVKVLSFPDHVTPVTSLIKMLNYCSNVIVLNISTTKLGHEQLRYVLNHMKCLRKLDIKWNFQVWHLLSLTSDHPNLKELTVRVYMRPGDDTEAFISSTHLWVKQWMAKEFVPQNVYFINAGLGWQYSLLVSELLRVWLKLNGNSPTGCTGFLKYYNKKWLNLYPNIPEFELEFGQTAVLPMVKISHFGVLGLEIDWSLVTKCVSGSETFYKAACISPAWLVENSKFSYVDSPILKCVVHLDLSCCGDMLSGHLEQLAISCPNIQQLNLQHNQDCLKSLQGLQAVATCCDNLQGLNILGVTLVENQVQLWQILSEIKLTHLAVDLCIVEPVGNTDRNKLIELYKKFVSLKALEFCSSSTSYYCVECDSNRDKGWLVTSFPFLEFCLIYDIHFLVVQDIIESCTELKYFNCSGICGDMLLPVCRCSLQQLDIDSEELELPDEFMSTISANGGLVCVLLNVGIVSIESITVLVENSPDLLMLHVSGVSFEEHIIISFKEKFCQRKLFTRGSFKLPGKDDVEIEHNTNLVSLWSQSVLLDTRIDSIS